MKTTQTEASKCAPLPFQGQKRNFVNEFKTALNEFIVQEQVDTIVDLFGGSGLLSHTAKRMYPKCTVIYNDYDDYHVRIANICKTNKLLAQIREILKSTERHAKLSENMKQDILRIVSEAQKDGFVDFITLSSSLLFSCRYALDFDELRKSTLYNNVKQDDYISSGYLDGIITVKSDYRELYERYKKQKGVLFIVDPPYLSTDTKTYNSNDYWQLKDYLDVLKVLSADNYIYFTSDKSQLTDLCQWFTENPDIRNPFMQAKIKEYQNKSYTLKYKDMMLYRGPNIIK